MFDRFTDRARRAILEAQDEAVEQRHGFIGAEHLLLGLLRVEDGAAGQVLAAAGVGLEPLREAVALRLVDRFDPGRPAVGASEALASIGIDLGTVKAQVEATFGPGALPDPGAAPKYAPQAKDALQQAVSRAQMLRHRFIGTEHMLVGILDGRASLACGALTDLGIDVGALGQRVIDQAAPAEARVDRAWHAVTALRGAVDRLGPDGRQRVAPVLARLADAHSRAIGAEQDEVARLADQTAEALEDAVAVARTELAKLGLDA
jgi:ATP-dependent Clp protease ATP-binding subunit ClpA